jgi:hypothetical protein
LNPTRYGNILYAEYTSLMDWNFEQYNGSEYKFYELFDLVSTSIAECVAYISIC